MTKRHHIIVLIIIIVIAMSGVAYAAINNILNRRPLFQDSGTVSSGDFISDIEKSKISNDEKPFETIPVYKEEDILFKTDGLFYLSRDSSFYDGQSARQNFTGTILQAYPTDAIREKSKNLLYFVYDTDTGYRLFLFFDEHDELTSPSGFPVVIKELLTYTAFDELNIGDSIEKVENIDPVTTLHKKQIIDVWDLDPVGAEFHAQNGYPCTSIHYLQDGILKIEYKMLENRDMIISDIEFNKDFMLTGATGYRLDYKISELDLPTVKWHLHKYRKMFTVHVSEDKTEALRWIFLSYRRV